MMFLVAEVEAHDEVIEWLDGLNQSDWHRTSVVIDRLASVGSQARMPFSRSLGEGLFEVRFTLGSTARRISYRFTRDGSELRREESVEGDHDGEQLPMGRHQESKGQALS